LAAPVLRHRIKLNFNADAEGVTADDIVQRMIACVPEVAELEGTGGRIPEVFRSADTG
jgi:MoxR-like ATPase